MRIGEMVKITDGHLNGSVGVVRKYYEIFDDYGVDVPLVWNSGEKGFKFKCD